MMSANQMYSIFRRVICFFCITLALQSCVGMIVGAAVDTTIEVVKVPFKVAGAAIDLAVPDKKDDDKDDKE